MQWPIEKGKNDQQWSKKKLHRKLKIEQHESHATLFFVGLFHYNAGINVIYNFSF
jgi:hypothetical protein